MNNKNIKLLCVLGLSALFSAPTLAEGIPANAQTPTIEPVRDVEPVYPQRAIDRKISGYTVVEYKIGADGRAEDIKIVESEPSNVFDKASKRAITRTTYDEKDAAEVKGDTFYRVYVFELDKTNANQLALAN